MTIYLTLEDVLEVHRQVIAETGGSAGIRDVRLLDSAVHRSQASFAGFDLYPSLVEKAAALMHSLIMNHPFVDGNKRAAFTAADVFLRLNGWELAAKEDELFEFVMAVADGRMPFEQIAPWIEGHLAEVP
jgi:death-on-curing protein